MKTNRANSTNSAVITNSRWLAYATAGAASAFTCANSAEGTIHYSGPINELFRYDQRSAFQLDQPGDFFRLIHFSTTNYHGFAYFSVRGKAGASIAGFYPGCPYFTPWASNLERGQLISNRPFVPAHSALLAVGGGGVGYVCNGEFAVLDSIGYIGFKFNNGSGDQYGWVRIKMQATPWHRNFILIDAAYGDVGDRIRTGQTSDQSNDPELESLGGLALGAAGLLAWRKRRALVAQQS